MDRYKNLFWRQLNWYWLSMTFFVSLICMEGLHWILYFQITSATYTSCIFYFSIFSSAPSLLICPFPKPLLTHFIPVISFHTPWKCFHGVEKGTNDIKWAKLAYLGQSIQEWTKCNLSKTAFKKIWRVLLFLKAIFHKFYLLHSLILSSI